MAPPDNSLALSKDQPEIMPPPSESKGQRSALEPEEDAAPGHCVPEPLHLEAVVEARKVRHRRLCLGCSLAVRTRFQCSLPLCTFRVAQKTMPRKSLLPQDPQQ